MRAEIDPERAVGLRVADERRHGRDRRGHERAADDRRRKQRRRFRLRSVLFSLLTLALPTSAKWTPLQNVAHATVSTTVTSFDPIPPERAYDPLIREAAALFNLDAALICSVIQTE